MNTDPKTLFHVARNGEALGERTQEEILSSIRRGDLKPDDLAWRDGMAEWQPIGSIPELARHDEISAAPGTPPSQPTTSSPSATATSTAESGPEGPLLSPARNPLNPETNAPPLASLGARFLGAFADGFLLSAAFMVPILIIDGPQVFADDSADPSDTATIVAMAAVIALAVLQLVLLSMRGQSLGKILAKTRIHLHATGEQAGFLNAVLLRGFIGNLPSNIPILGAMYAIVNICFIFRADRRCIHDLIGGTIVCKAG